MPIAVPAQLNSPETKIQFTLVWKASKILPAIFETLLYSGKNPPALPQTAYRVIVAHPRSRGQIETRNPYTERETLSYKITVELRNLTQETIATDTTSLLKRGLRGFVPIIGPTLTPILVSGSDFGGHSKDDGTWIWTIDASLELRRSEGEVFELLPEVALSIGQIGAELLPLPEGFVLESVGFGVYRSPIPGLDKEKAVLDRELIAETGYEP